MRTLLLLLALLLIACPPSRDPGGATTPAAGDLGGCEPESVLETTCSFIESEEVVLEGFCDFGQGAPMVFRTGDEWGDFLARCDTDVLDPIEGMDWGAWDVVGTAVWVGGCSGTHGTLWVADCGTSQQLAYYSTGCGDCDAIWVTTHLLAVPAGTVDQLQMVSCVPSGEECVSEDTQGPADPTDDIDDSDGGGATE